MQEFMSKDKEKTIVAYAKTVLRTSKALRTAWVNLWQYDYQVGPQTILGEEMKKLLENKSMKQGVWETIHGRIAGWAERLVKTVEDLDDAPLSSLVYGRPPQWWIHCRENGFTGGHFEGGVHVAENPEVSKMRAFLQALQRAYTPALAVDSFLQMADIVQIQVCVELIRAWTDEMAPTRPAHGTWS